MSRHAVQAQMLPTGSADAVPASETANRAAAIDVFFTAFLPRVARAFDARRLVLAAV